MCTLRGVLHEHIDDSAFLGADKARPLHSHANEILFVRAKVALLLSLYIRDLAAGPPVLLNFAHIIAQSALFEDLHQQIKGLVDAGVIRIDTYPVKPLARFHVA